MERFIRRDEVAAMMGMTPRVAASILATRGVYPIDFGMGRSRGPRWLESAVSQALSEMYQEAQPPDKKNRQKRIRPSTVSLSSMGVNDIFNCKRSQGKVPEIIESNEVAGMRTIEA